MIGTDLARYVYWVHLRELFDARDPSSLKVAATALSRAHRMATPQARRRMIDELRQTFQPRCGALSGEPLTEATLQALMRDAYDLDVQSHLEELVLGRMDEATLQRWVRPVDAHHLQAAREAGRGVVVVFPKLANMRLMSAWLAYAGPYAQVLPRSAEDGASWLGQRARERREKDESVLPGRWIDFDVAPDAPREALAAGQVLGWPLDGRAGATFVATRYLGRPARLVLDPWTLAVAFGAQVVPAVIRRVADRTHRLSFFAPLDARGAEPAALMRSVLDGCIEPWLRTHPEHYGPWLNLCRERAAQDRWPLFEDYP